MNDLRLKHTNPSFRGVVVALVIIVVVCGMIEFVRFLSICARSNVRHRHNTGKAWRVSATRRRNVEATRRKVLGHHRLL